MLSCRLIDYNSPASIKKILEENGMSMQKKFGQNFLINGYARKKIIDQLDIGENTSVWEVGPGLGAMTFEILNRGAVLTVFEIDKGFSKMLKIFYKDYISNGKLFIIEGDVLKNWKKILKETGLPDRFFGNLPYNIAASLIADTIEEGIRFEKMLVTVQKEVAQRMCASAGCSDYSSFSILCKWAYNLKPFMDLSGGNFWPKPNVSSKAVIMEKKEEFPCCKNPKNFIKLQRALFSSRRKNIRNNLTKFLFDGTKALDILEKARINPSIRAETLDIDKILLLSDILNTDII